MKLLSVQSAMGAHLRERLAQQAHNEGELRIRPAAIASSLQSGASAAFDVYQSNGLNLGFLLGVPTPGVRSTAARACQAVRSSQGIRR